MSSSNICILLVLLFFGFVENKDICDLDDLECVTRGTRNVYMTLLEAVNDTLKIEPLVLYNINGNIPGFKYVVMNATLSPMKNCEPTVTFLNESSYAYRLQCTRLILRANVVAKGRLGPIDVDGSDSITITADNYVIVVRGQLTIDYNQEDQSKRFNLINKNFNIDTEARGNITFEASSMFDLTETQAVIAASYFKSEWKILENTFRYPTITEFMMELQVRRVGRYLKETPMDKIIPKE